MNPAVSFRPMQEADLPSVLATEQAAFSHPWTPGLFRDALSSYQCWLICLNGQPIGHGVLQLILDEAHLLNITINPNQQGQGYGLALLTHLMDQAQTQGARDCYLEVRASNQAAYRLYERFGFNEIGRRPNYYPAAQGREDALVMACSLFEGM